MRTLHFGESNIEKSVQGRGAGEMAQCIRGVLCIRNQASMGHSLNLSSDDHDDDEVADSFSQLPSQPCTC